MKIEKITFEYEDWEDVDASFLTSGESTVTLQLDNGKQYYAWLVTPNYVIKHMQTRQKHYFWLTDMLIVDSMDYTTVENIVNKLIEEGHFEDVFDQIIPNDVWLFFGLGQENVTGVFSRFNQAEYIIKQNKLTGALVQYPMDDTLLSWERDKHIDNDELYRHYDALIKQPDIASTFTDVKLKRYRYKQGKKYEE